MVASIEDQICRHFQAVEEAKAKAENRKLRTVPKPWKRPHPEALCQEPELLEAVREYSYDLSDEGFQAYCRTRGVLHVAGEPGTRRWAFHVEHGKVKDECLADPYFHSAQEHHGARHKYSEHELDVGWGIIELGRARLQDCWELYQVLQRRPASEAVIQRSYELVEPTEPAMAWADYARLVRREWEKLLSTDCSESKVQDFLERHPCMVPRVGRDPRLPVLVSQPRLPGWKSKVPDFLWIGHDSLSVYAVLIEIEKPSKRIFRKDGDRTHHFTHAQDQLRAWQVWFGNRNNQAAFLEHYELEWNLGGPFGLGFGAEYVLVYGRRREFEGSPELVRARAHQQASGEQDMTFDHLKPDPSLDDIVSVRDGAGGFQALHVPPTLTLGPMHAVKRLRIGGLEQAILKNRYLSPERRRFLLERLPYWNEWASGPHAGPIGLGDCE